MMKLINKTQQKICTIWRKAKQHISSFVGGQFKKRQTLTNNKKKMNFIELLTNLWNYIKTDSGQFLVNLIAIITFICTLGKQIFNGVYYFFIKTKSIPHLSYDNRNIIIKIPLSYKKQRKFNVYEIDILNYYHKKGFILKKRNKYPTDRLKIQKNTLNATTNLHYFDYEISPIDIINFKLNGEIFIDISFKELNGSPINKTYNLSRILKKNKQLFEIIINRQKELSNGNFSSKLTEEQKNKLRRKINPDFDKRDSDE